MNSAMWRYLEYGFSTLLNGVRTRRMAQFWTGTRTRNSCEELVDVETRERHLRASGWRSARVRGEGEKRQAESVRVRARDER